MGQYDDIINLPHHQSIKRPQMSMHDRAAQFAPFAALKGYDDAVIETARLTDHKIELDESEILKINDTLKYISDNIDQKLEVKIVFFEKDSKKDGGAYLTKIGMVKKIDILNESILLEDETKINLSCIYSINIK